MRQSWVLNLAIREETRRTDAPACVAPARAQVRPSLVRRLRTKVPIAWQSCRAAFAMPAVSAGAWRGTPVVTRSGRSVGVLDRILVEIERGTTAVVVVDKTRPEASYLVDAARMSHRRGGALVIDESVLAITKGTVGGRS